MPSGSPARALILEGGAMRSVFTAGVLDAFHDRAADIPAFDLAIGTSAGAACATSYLAGQRDRNRRIFVDYMTSRAFVDPWRALRGGSYFDMEYLMGDVALTIDPLDQAALCASPTRLEAAVVHADTAIPAYLPTQNSDCLEAMLATAAIPVLFRRAPTRFRGRSYFDGGVADPVPIRRAIDCGATDITVVLTKSQSWRPTPMALTDRLLLRALTASYPAIYRAATNRHHVYARLHALIAAPPPGIRIRAVYPPEGYPVTRYTRDIPKLEQGYAMGLAAGRQIELK